ncbi:MAG: CrcB family protein [Terrimesophilobacter sp.]
MIVTTILLAVAGGIGAALRLIVNRVVHSLVASTYPVAMSIINISGSFTLGLVMGLFGQHLLPEHWDLFIGVGLVGGFTAFSTTSFQTVRLIQTHHRWLAVANSFGMLAVAIAAAGVGLWLGGVL